MKAEGKLDELALLVARGLSVSAAARKLGVSERTGRSWAQREDFRAKVKHVRGEVFASATAVLTRLAGRAANTLGNLLASADEDVRLRAAKELLAHLLPVHSAVEVEERLARLEVTHASKHSRTSRSA